MGNYILLGDIMITVKECICKTAIVRDDDQYNHRIRYEEVEFLNLSLSKKFVQVRWDTGKTDWLSVDDFQSTNGKYTIEEILGDIPHKENPGDIPHKENPLLRSILESLIAHEEKNS